MKPKYLDNKSKITLVAPSFGCTTEPYYTKLKKGIQTLESLGYELFLGKNIFKNLGVAGSNTPKKRAKEFMDAWKSETEAIISVGGGETMEEILEFINFSTIKKYPPKWFVGFSDNTNLTYTITVNTDIETIYGTNAPNYQEISYDSKDTLDMLHGKKHFEGYDNWQLNQNPECTGYNFDMKTEIIPYNYYEPFTGIMLGGCLDCLSNLAGTRFDKTVNYIKRHKDDKIIFYLEACDLTSIGIRIALFRLKNTGWFKNVAGFVIGRSYQYYDESFGTTPKESYIDLLKEFNVPILLDCDLGHLAPAMPIMNGAKATVSLKNNKLIVDYE